MSRIEDPIGTLIRFINYMDVEARELKKPYVQQRTHLGKIKNWTPI